MLLQQPCRITGGRPVDCMGSAIREDITSVIGLAFTVAVPDILTQPGGRKSMRVRKGNSGNMLYVLPD